MSLIQRLKDKHALYRLAQFRMGIEDAYADTELINAIVELEGAPEYAIQNVEQTYANAENIRHAGERFGNYAWLAYDRVTDAIDFSDEGEYV